VIFRVTQTEYDRLRVACAEAGARTLSDYTRSGVLSSIDTDSQGMTVLERFHVIDQKLGELKETVTRVADLLTAPDAAPGKGGPSSRPKDD